jgi:quinoprotein glucose dehydrogenase
MKFRIALVVLASVFVTGAVRQIAAQDEGKTVWDGVYTQEQAVRGRAAYTDQCASCHGAELSGGEMAPPLAGGLFTGNWDGLTAGDLTERIRITMPQGKEGTLSRQQVADIVAAVFAANSYPAGTTELPKELETQKTIKIAPRK